jgi:hypothetical protein
MQQPHVPGSVLVASFPASINSTSHARIAGSLPGLEGGVSLTKGTLVPPPVLHERWFHVEHTPVQVPTSLLRSAFDQSVNLRVDRLDREQRRQLRKTSDWATGKPCLDALRSDPHPNRLPAPAGHYPTRQHEGLGSAPNQSLVPRRTK